MGHKKCFFPSLASALLGILVGFSFYLLKLTDEGYVLHSTTKWFELQAGAHTITFSAGIYLDFIAAVMLCLISSVGFLVYLYSIAYMQQETAVQRYFALLSFFMVAMLALILADNLILLWMAWELAGFAAYLLIGFWYQQVSVAEASTKALLMNQLGSTSLLIGILMVGSELGSFDLATLSALAAEARSSQGWLWTTGLFLIGGVVTKSAQFPVFHWLPSAMTAPTPASALIHAATLVSAGAYLLIRTAGLLSPEVCTLVAFLGSITALMGSYAALAQYDIKKMLAYSTIAQLGYVVMAIGIGKSSAGLFHLVTHAFFKACLFLCVGAVSHFLLRQGKKGLDVQDIRAMGGLRKALPGVFYSYLVAAGALVGLPGCSGFLSKEAILTHSLSWAKQQAQTGNYLSYIVPALGFLSSCLTAIYLGRQCQLVFMGVPRWQPKPSLKVVPTRNAIPYLMQVSIIILALCSLGFLYSPLSWDFQHSWLLQRLSAAPLLGTIPTLPQTAPFISVLMMGIGLILVAVRRPLSQAIALPLLRRLTRLSFHGWYLDVITDAITQQVLGLSRLVARIDQRFVAGCRSVAVSYLMLGSIVSWLDRNLVEGIVYFVAAAPQQLGKLHRFTQQGNLQHYLLWMFISIALLLIGYLF